jgi:quinol-cytochrome oxidoreductase complex cytochrome b subunit
MSAPAGPSAAARSVVLGILGAELALLAVTGVALSVLYRPTGASSTTDALAAVHRFTAGLTWQTAVVAAILLVAGRTPVLPGWRGRVHAATLPVLAVAASFTGRLLPWSMLGLWAVEVGRSRHGFGVLLDDDIRFAVVGSADVAPATLFRWLIVHALVLGPALIAATALAWRARGQH